MSEQTFTGYLNPEYSTSSAGNLKLQIDSKVFYYSHKAEPAKVTNLLGRTVAVVYRESEYTDREGVERRSRWINSIAAADPQQAAQVAQGAPQGTTPQPAASGSHRDRMIFVCGCVNNALRHSGYDSIDIAVVAKDAYRVACELEASGTRVFELTKQKAAVAEKPPAQSEPPPRTEAPADHADFEDDIPF